MKLCLCFGCFNHILLLIRITDLSINLSIFVIAKPVSIAWLPPKSKIPPKTDSPNSDVRSSNPSVSFSITSQSLPITSALVSGESAISMRIVPVFLTHLSLSVK